MNNKMEEKELRLIGEFLNLQGYGLDLSSQFWMEEYISDDHKFRDIAELFIEYEKFMKVINNPK
jgi:hypothetical protein